MANMYIPYEGPVVTREEARALGAKRFFTGRPCKRNHLSERLVSSPYCIECVAAKNGTWAKANPDKHAAQMRAWRIANPDKWSGVVRKNRAKSLPDLAAREAARRASAKMATPSWCDLDEVKKIYKRCGEVSAVTGVKHHVDHIVPLQNKSVCGLHVPWNLRIITAVENHRKHANFYPELAVAA